MTKMFFWNLEYFPVVLHLWVPAVSGMSMPLMWLFHSCWENVKLLPYHLTFLKMFSLFIFPSDCVVASVYYPTSNTADVTEQNLSQKPLTNKEKKAAVKDRT